MTITAAAGESVGGVSLWYILEDGIERKGESRKAIYGAVTAA